MPAQGPAAPADVARKSCRMYFWPLFLVLAAVAAIFIYDLYWNNPADPQRAAFRNMHSSSIMASSGFENLISTLCWLFGLGFLVNGGMKLFRSWRCQRKDPAFAPKNTMALVYIFIGICLFGFPFLRQALFCPYHYNYNHVYYLGGQHHLSRYVGVCQREMDTVLGIFVAVTLLFGALVYFFGDGASRRARRPGGEPGVPALTQDALKEDKAPDGTAGIQTEEFLILLPLTVAALLFSVGVFTSPAPVSTFSQNMAACYSNISNIIWTIFGTLSLFFTLAGARDLYRAERRVKDDPSLARLPLRIWIYFFLGVTFLALPFLLAIYNQSGRPPVEYAPAGPGASFHLQAYSCTGPAIEMRNFLRLVAALCWYCAALGFYMSHLALSKALRFKETPEAALLNQEAAILLLTSFTVTTLPFVCVALMGVGLW